MKSKNVNKMEWQLTKVCENVIKKNSSLVEKCSSAKEAITVLEECLGTVNQLTDQKLERNDCALGDHMLTEVLLKCVVVG